MFNYFLLPPLKKFIFLFLVLCFLWPSSVLASTIKLVSGKVVEGDIVEQNDDFIKVDTGIGFALTYYLEDVYSIDGALVALPEEKPTSPIELQPVDQDDSVEILDPISITDTVKPKKDDRPVSLTVEKKIAREEPSVLPSKSKIKKTLPPSGESKAQVLEPISIIKEKETREKAKAKVLAEAYAFIEKKRAEKALTESKLESAPIKDIAVVENRSLSKESPSPFGPTIRKAESTPPKISTDGRRQKVIIELEKDAEKKQLKALRASSKQAPIRRLGAVLTGFFDDQSQKFSRFKSYFGQRALFIQEKFEQIPIKVRKDMFLIGILLSAFMYILVCFPLMLIAKKLDRKHIWLAWVPIVHLFYLIYIAKKPLWFGLLYFVPIASAVLPLVLFMYIGKLLKKPFWIAILTVVPVINIFTLWYFALAKIEEEPTVVRIDFNKEQRGAQ